MYRYFIHYYSRDDGSNIIDVWISRSSVFWRLIRVRLFIWTEIRPQWFIFKNARGVSINRSTDKTEIRAWTTIKWPAMRQMFVYSQGGSFLYTYHAYIYTAAFYIIILVLCGIVWHNSIYLLRITYSVRIIL